MPLDNPDLTEFTTASQQVVSYNFTDIADGTNSQIYYVTSTIDNGGEDFILTTQTFAGADRATGRATLEGAEAEHNFDLTSFNVPTTVKGTATISCTNFNDAAPLSSSCTFRLHKWDGASETNVSALITSATNTTTKEMLIAVPMTETHFAEGDVLRLAVDFAGTNTGQGIGIDPSGVTQSLVGTALQPFKLIVPFKLDI